MTELPLRAPNILSLYLQLSQYPILSRRIRMRMREELYGRGVVTMAQFEQEVKAKAVQSQHREGLTDPMFQEDEQIWEERLREIRDDQTDFYFANNLPMDIFHQIVRELLAERNITDANGEGLKRSGLAFTPELAPVELLLQQAEQYEKLPELERLRVKHHSEEINVVLIKTMISDQLSFIRVAKNWFTAADFKFIAEHRIGTGKIGGKAAGMLLAWKILHSAAPHLAGRITLPRSYFLGADVFYEFKTFNKLEHNQKYKPLEQIRDEYPNVQTANENARFPDHLNERLRDLLRELGHTPIIVRSSSLLEDNFGTSFVGKYDSYFCPNQGTLDENFRELSSAIRRIYASVYSPDVIIYRNRMGLLDYDERMAILIQEVQGRPFRDYYFPSLSGVAYSRSQVVWSPRLRPEDGFVRLVMGLGTRAVDRVGEDYPRMIFLSHPTLRPEKTTLDLEHYSQHLLDVIDLKQNAFKSVPMRGVLNVKYPGLRWVASVLDEEGQTLLPVKSLGPNVTPERLVLTFENLLARTDFAEVLRTILATLAEHYGFQVDIEFAATLTDDLRDGQPQFIFHLLQCRPQSVLRGGVVRPMPTDLPADQVLFQTSRLVPQGEVVGVEYVIYVDPEGYNRLPTARLRTDTAHVIGRLNKVLETKSFILIGPGRWGSSNIQLGVPVTYADIYNAKALIELAIRANGMSPDPSYGTHFFQDLVEAQIYPLAVYPGERGEALNAEFLDHAANRLSDFVADPGEAGACIKVIHIPSHRQGQHLDVVMDGEQALAFFTAK